MINSIYRREIAQLAIAATVAQAASGSAKEEKNGWDRGISVATLMVAIVGPVVLALIGFWLTGRHQADKEISEMKLNDLRREVLGSVERAERASNAELNEVKVRLAEIETAERTSRFLADLLFKLRPSGVLKDIPPNEGPLQIEGSTLFLKWEAQNFGQTGIGLPTPRISVTKSFEGEPLKYTVIHSPVQPGTLMPGMNRRNGATIRIDDDKAEAAHITIAQEMSVDPVLIQALKSVNAKDLNSIELEKLTSTTFSFQFCFRKGVQGWQQCP